MLEVFAAMHLLAGYPGVVCSGPDRRASARIGIRAGNLVHALRLYFARRTRMAFCRERMVVWMPLLFCAMENWLNGRAGWRWLLTAGLTIGGFYYIGFPQFWFYGMLLLGSHRGGGGDLRTRRRAAIDLADCRQSPRPGPAVADT